MTVNANEQGIQAMQQGEFEQAAKHFNDAIEANPTDPTGYVNMGTLLQAIGDHKRAVVFYDKALELDSAFGAAHYAKGALAYELEQVDLAEASLRQALLSGMDDADLHFMLGLTYKAMGDFVRALPRLREAKAKAAEDVEITFQYGLALAQNEQLDMAVEALEDTLDLDASHTDARYNLAIAYAFLGEQDKTYAELERVLELQPDHELARDAKAKMDELLGN